jgi:hypothetical protein
MTDLLFDTPWWIPVLIAGIGVVVFMTGNKRVENRVRYAGLAILLLAVVVVVVSYFVETDKEVAERRSRELVDAFEQRDWSKMSSILDPGAIVTVPNATVYKDRDDIIANAKLAHDRYHFKSVNVLGSHPEQTQTSITVTIKLISEQDVPSMLNSEWQFEWQERAGGWTLVEVRGLQIGQFNAEQIQQMFPGGGRGGRR